MDRFFVIVEGREILGFYEDYKSRSACLLEDYLRIYEGGVGSISVVFDLRASFD